MSESGGVGGASAGGGGASSGVGGSSSSSESSSGTSSDTTSNDSQTTGESLASSPTTADSLAGGQAASPDNTNTASAKSGDPAAGTGSLDAAVSAAQNSSTQDPDSKESQEAVTPDTPAPVDDVTPDTPAPVFDQDALNPNANTNPNLGVQTSESRTSAASIAGSVAEGLLNGAKDQVDRSGRKAAAATLTNGNAGRLPAAGYANRADLANTLTDAKMNAAKALDATPYGPNALSTQQLSSAAKNASRLGKAAGAVGTLAGPLVGAYEGYQASPAQSTTGERIANMLGGGLKEADDSLVSAGAGTAATAGQAFVGGLMTAGGVTSPAGVAVIATSPATGTATSIAASKAYDGTGIDNAWDNFVDNTIEPAIAKGIDNSISGYDTLSSWASDAAKNVRSWF